MRSNKTVCLVLSIKQETKSHLVYVKTVEDPGECNAHIAVVRVESNT